MRIQLRSHSGHILTNPIRVFLLAACLLTGQAHGQEQQQQEREGTIESVRQEVQDLNQELAEFTADRRQQLMEDIEGTLKAIDTRVEALETRLKDEWDEMDEVARAHARSTLGALRRERARVAEWYQRMQDSSDFTWESMKEGFNDAFDGLSEAWQTAEEDVDKAASDQQ